MILKLLGTEIGISTANCFSNTANLVRIINTGTAGVANIAYSNGVVYANVTVGNTESVIIEKGLTDLLQGTSSMKAVPVAYRY
jgi:hypothetical protein